VPLSIVAIAIALKVLNRDRNLNPQPFDILGSVLMAIAASTLLFAVSKGHDLSWKNPLIIGLLIASAFAWPTFFIVENRHPFPALDLKLFRNGMFSASTAAAFLCYISTASVSFLMPFFLISGCGFGESTSGYIMSSTSIVMMLLTGISGHLSDKIGVRTPSTLGLLLMAIGVGYLSFIQPGVSPWMIVIGTALMGLGAGMFTAPNNSAIMGSAPPDRQGVAGAVIASARTIGFASGIAFAGLVYLTRLHSSVELRPSFAVSDSVHAGFRFVMVVCLCGALLSAVRGNNVQRQKLKIG
jgi:MFS family permease